MRFLSAAILIFFWLYVTKVNPKPNYNRPDYYCGKHLPNALKVLCKGNTYSPWVDYYSNVFNGKIVLKNHLKVKDKMFSRNRRTNDLVDWISPQFGRDSFISKYEANALDVPLSQFRRINRNGIVEECCENPCTVDELSEYCESV